MLSLVSDFQQNKPLVLNPKFVRGLKSILCDLSLDKVCAFFFFLPSLFKWQGYIDWFWPFPGFHFLVSEIHFTKFIFLQFSLDNWTVSYFHYSHWIMYIFCKFFHRGKRKFQCFHCKSYLYRIKPFYFFSRETKFQKPLTAPRFPCLLWSWDLITSVNIQEFIAKAITLPGEGEIMDMMEVADPDAVHAVRSFIRKQLAQELRSELLSTVCVLKYSDGN